MRILLISDNHGYCGEEIMRYAADCDEVWHAGDWLSLSVHEALIGLNKPIRGVYGNVDGTEVRVVYPELNVFEIDGKRFMMIHIAGYPGRYAKGIQALINDHKPEVLICGHSHVLRVMRDPANDLLYLNPGACGTHGFHKVRTALRFEVNENGIKGMEVIEFGSRTTPFYR